MKIGPGREAQLRDAEILADLDWLIGDERGRRILFRLFQSAGLWDPCMRPELVAYAEGRRSVAQEFFRFLASHRPDALALILVENRPEQRQQRSGGDASSGRRARRGAGAGATASWPSGRDADPFAAVRAERHWLAGDDADPDDAAPAG